MILQGKKQQINLNFELALNKMNCELMLTYDTPALRQTGSRNLTGQKNASHDMGYLPYSPNGKRNIRDPFKENIDSLRTVAMIQRRP